MALATEAAARMQKEFGLPLALVVIATVVAAAGYSKVGEESDAAIGQEIMNVMEEVAQRSGVLVLGIDHFGKSAETGTRGTSAKEGAADVVLALLGAKSISGEITNTRLATRKRRSGPSGEEFPFTVQSVDLGIDQDGSQITSLVINWGGRDNRQPDRRDRWSKSLRLLRQALMKSATTALSSGPSLMGLWFVPSTSRSCAKNFIAPIRPKAMQQQNRPSGRKLFAERSCRAGTKSRRRARGRRPDAGLADQSARRREVKNA